MVERLPEQFRTPAAAPAVGGGGEHARPSRTRAEEALAAPEASFERVEAVWQDARDKLRVLNAELDEAVARAVELSLSSAETSDVSLLAGDVDNLVGDLE